MKLFIKYLINILTDVYRIFNFRKSHGSFLGVYKNFQEASQNFPGDNFGYNNEQSSQRLLIRCREISKKIQQHEYPLFFYLNIILNEKKFFEIFDLGGAFAVHYLNFIKFSIHHNFNYTICDVERIIEKARLEFKQYNNLYFTSNQNDLENKDIFISSGALCYIDDFSIAKINNKPQHVLLTRIPLQNKVPTFVTVQNASSSFNPTFVFNRYEFINNYLNFGYKLIDEWKSDEQCIIPLNRNISVTRYSGFYFKKI